FVPHKPINPPWLSPAHTGRRIGARGAAKEAGQGLFREACSSKQEGQRAAEACSPTLLRRRRGLAALLILRGKGISQDLTPLVLHFSFAASLFGNGSWLKKKKKKTYVLLANPEAHLAQSKRLAEAALEPYNKRKKIKFELVDVKPCISVPEPRCCYTHINSQQSPARKVRRKNFSLRSFTTVAKKSSKEQRSHTGRRGSSRGLFVTCCEPLGPDSTVGQKFLKPDGTSRVRKHADFAYCLACSERASHPKGEKYIAGHCNIPSIYNCVR
ncbi:hypothetical protein EJB05_01066, partial [Eragrostis curvula]